MHKKDPSKAKGGIARRDALAPEERTEIARRAASARWGSTVPTATHEGMLKIGGSDVQCYVLEDESRILSTRGVMRTLGRSWRGRKHAGTKLPVFLEAKNLLPFITSEIAEVLNPVEFRVKKGGVMAEGMNAEALPAVCEVYRNAFNAGVLTKAQYPIAQQCETLLIALANVGVKGLVDEATGYQDVRDRKALQIILNKYLTDDYAKWSKTFPDEFYKHLFRLKGIPWPVEGGRRPQYVGHWTNSMIYDRLAPGIKDELKRKNPKTESGSRRRKNHQHLTPDYGHPELTDLIKAEIFLMKGCRDWDTFERMLDEAKPKHGSTLSLMLDEP